MGVYLFFPNIIGYVRLLLLVGAFALSLPAHVILALYCIQAAFDWVDGMVARRLGQCSAFGAWLDVVVDNIGRTLLWCAAAPRVGPAIACVEWLAFVCTHQLGEHWKQQFAAAPGWVAAVMRNGFKSPAGVVAIGALHVLPIWLFATAHELVPLAHPVTRIATAGLVLGRLYCAAVESWVISRHAAALVALHGHG